jgi:hypothetical protein
MILSIEQPMWTDQVQAWAGIAGILSALVGFIILFIKDRNKEKQIKKLSDIASHLSQIAADSERRYRISKKPHLTISSEFLDDGMMKIIFQNSNSNTTIATYSASSLQYDGVILIHPVSDSRGSQSFDLWLEASKEDMEAISIEMEYITSEGFVYQQRINVLRDELEVGVDRHPIFHESEIDK